jgi:intein-encoded DNA endonuclease-like protein
LKRRAEGMSYNAIIGTVERDFGVRLSKSHVSNWIRGINAPDGSVTKFQPIPSASLGYVIGTMLGDGSSALTGDHNYKLKLKVHDLDFAEAFARAIGLVLSRSTPGAKFNPKTRAWHVEVSSLLLYRFLRLPLKEIKVVIELNNDCSGGFLRGFFDSEGCVYEGSVTASNTGTVLIQLVLSQLRRLGIQATGPYLMSKGGRPVIIKGKTYWANYDCYGIRIRNASREDFLNKVGFGIRRKRDALRKALTGANYSTKSSSDAGDKTDSDRK